MLTDRAPRLQHPEAYSLVYTLSDKAMVGTDLRLQQIVTIARAKWDEILAKIVPLEARLQTFLSSPVQPPPPPPPPVPARASINTSDNGETTFGDDAALREEAPLEPASSSVGVELPALTEQAVWSTLKMVRCTLHASLPAPTLSR